MVDKPTSPNPKIIKRNNYEVVSLDKQVAICNPEKDISARWLS